MKQSRGSIAQKASLNGNVECLWYVVCFMENYWNMLRAAHTCGGGRLRLPQKCCPMSSFSRYFSFWALHEVYYIYHVVHFYIPCAWKYDNSSSRQDMRYPSTLLLLFFEKTNLTWKRVKISFSSVSLALRSWYSLFNLILFSRLAVRIISN